MSYHHFTIDERESILIYCTQGLNFSQIAKLLHRHPSSISRKWKRHLKEGRDSPSHEQKSYYIAKSHCGRKRMLEIDHNLSNTVKHLFLDYQWSPEEIEGQLRLEHGKTVISNQTIYRAIYRGHFDDNSLSHVKIEVYFPDPMLHGNEGLMRIRMDYSENIFQKEVI